MFAISTHSITRIGSFAEADAHFNNTKKPRTNRWLPFQRPLRNTAATHLSLEQRVDETGRMYYDCVLFQTALVRYYQPDTNGDYAVHLKYDQSQSSRAFTGKMGWWHGMTALSDADQRVSIPISGSVTKASELWGDGFGTRLVFDAGHRLLMGKSAHVPMFRRSSTATMRARRKALKQHLDVMLTMLDMQYTSTLDDIMVDLDEGAPFKGKIKRNQQAEQLARTLAAGSEIHHDDMTTLFKYVSTYGKHVMNNMINRRLYKEVVMTHGWNRGFSRDDFEDGAYLANQPDDLRKIITPTQDEVRKAVTTHLVHIAGLHPDKMLPYPQFPAVMPRAFYSANLQNNLDFDAYSKLVSRKGVVY